MMGEAKFQKDCAVKTFTGATEKKYVKVSHYVRSPAS